ncbi:MAG: ABC transporter permease [Clostridiales bacterium]|nr:ABC transporter permease [Clostridiales bacterium]
MTAIYKREFKAFFRNMTGFIYIALFLIVMAFLSNVINFSNRVPNFEYVMFYMRIGLIVMIPILTMRSFSEEKKQKTDQLLFSLPVSTSKIVLGKYLSTLTVFAVPVVISCAYPLILSKYDASGAISYGASYGTILAFLLLGASLIAVGIFMSSLTENQIIAAVLSFAYIIIDFLISFKILTLPSSSTASFIGIVVLIAIMSLIIFALTKNSTIGWMVFIILDIPLAIVRFIKPDLLEGGLTKVLDNISLFDKLYDFATGVFNVNSIVYFLTITGLFLFFTVQSLEKRRWS